MVPIKQDKQPSAQTLSLQQRLWQIDDFLPAHYQIPRQFLQRIDQNRHRNFVQLLSRHVYSEGDSRPLFQYLMNRQTEFSPAFLQLLSAWFSDEQKHYQALRQVFYVLSGVEFEAMDQVFASRNHEIEPIQALLQDELTILVAFLFDEMGSMISYRRDLREYYQHYGPALAGIAKQLVMDEGVHFQNAVQVIQIMHYERYAEIPALLGQVAQLEKALGRYCQSFFLDHAQEQHRFPPNFNQVIIQMILAHLGWGDYPPAAYHLWSWRPAGQTFTPLVT